MNNTVSDFTRSRRALKTSAVLSAILLATVSAVCFYGPDNSDARDAKMQSVIQETTDVLYEGWNVIMLDEYGITYDAYCTAMEYLAGKAIYISAEEDQVAVKIIDSVDRGKTFTDSQLNGDFLRVYIDTVSMSILSSAGVSGFTAVLGAMIGSAALPGIGTISGAALGTALGVVIGSSASGLFTFINEQLELDSGIWLDFLVRWHFDLLGHRIYFPLPPTMWALIAFGAQ